MGDLFAHASEPDAAEHQEPPSQFGSIQDGCVPPDVSLFLQPVHAVKDGRGRKMYFQGKVLDGDTAVFLEVFQDQDVGLVECFHHGAIVFF